MSDGIEEGWSLGCDNVPPWEKAARERRFAEKRRQKELEKSMAARKTEAAAQPPPARERGSGAGAGNDYFDGVIEPFPGTTALAGKMAAPQAGGTPALHSGATQKVQQPWQTISGLTPDGEAKMSRSERRFAIRKLFREFEARIRVALGEHEKDSERDERTFLWTPLEAICIELGIARRKLSSLTKELTGMSAQETVDRIRAETVSANVKAKLAEKARATYANYFAEDEKEYRAGSVPPKWKNPDAVGPAQLEKERQAARAFAEAGITVRPANGWSGCANQLLQRTWDARRTRPGIGWSERKNFAARQEFARELGFSSYARLYRACLLSSGKSPMELEHLAAVELFDALDAEFSPAREKVREEVLKG